MKVGKFPFKAIGKALVYGEYDGFVKIVADEATNDLLGVHMIGPHVTDLISEAGLAMRTRCNTMGDCSHHSSTSNSYLK